MDPITAAVLAGLTAFVTKSTQELLQSVGSSATEKLKQLFGAVKGRWIANPAAAGDLERFAEDPKLYAPVVQSRLDEWLSADAEFRADVARIVGEIGPKLTIVQRIAEAKGVTGLDADELHRGQVSVQQELDSATDVTGARINRIG